MARDGLSSVRSPPGVASAQGALRLYEAAAFSRRRGAPPPATVCMEGDTLALLAFVTQARRLGASRSAHQGDHLIQAIGRAPCRTSAIWEPEGDRARQDASLI